MFDLKLKAFTLVELIVVLTIVSILSTVGFVAYVDYLKGVRDTNRLQQMSEIYRSMELFATRTKLPFPDDDINIVAGAANIGYQGYAGESVLESVRFSDGGTDPKTKQYYSYMLSADRKSAQLLGFFETQESQELMSFQGKVSADYSTLFPQVVGIGLGILVDATTKIPVQENAVFQGSGKLDILTLSSNLTSYISNTEKITGQASQLLGIVPNTNCKRLREIFGYTTSGVYKINPSGVKQVNVYCDMTAHGGGWTMIARSQAIASADTSFGWLVERGTPLNDEEPYSLGSEIINIPFSEILFTTYTSQKNIEGATKMSPKINELRLAFANPSIDATQAYLYDTCETLTPLPDPPATSTGTIQDPCLDPLKYYGKVGYTDRYFLGWNSVHTGGFTIGGFGGSVASCTNPTGSYEIRMRSFCGKQGMIFVR